MQPLTPLILTALSLISLSCQRSQAVVVSSKNFTEEIILGEIAAQQLERKLHLPVERKLSLGGTLLTQEALVKGDIDIYPEYTGTAASVVLKVPASSDPGESYLRVKSEYLRRFSVIWLPPLGFNDTFAMAVRREDAARLPGPKLSDAGSRSWRLGVGYEFLTRPDGLNNLDHAYHLHWEKTPLSMDLGLLYQALHQKRVDMAAGNSTDASLADRAFTVLEDDRHAFPSYSACYLVRKQVSDQHPEIQIALSMLSNHIDAETMRQLNRNVEVDHISLERVAHNFLATQP